MEKGGGWRQEAERPGAPMGAMRGHLCVSFSIQKRFQRVYVYHSGTLDHPAENTLIFTKANFKYMQTA